LDASSLEGISDRKTLPIENKEVIVMSNSLAKFQPGALNGFVDLIADTACRDAKIRLAETMDRYEASIAEAESLLLEFQDSGKPTLEKVLEIDRAIAIAKRCGDQVEALVVPQSHLH
jgi:hypothetical protein